MHLSISKAQLVWQNLTVKLQEILYFRRVRKNLPQTISQCATLILSGYSIQKSIAYLADNSCKYTARLFEEILQKHRAGISLANCLENQISRYQDEAWQLFFTALNIGARQGGQLHVILASAEKLATNQQALELKVQALTSQGKTQAIVTSLLPLAILLALKVIDPSYVAPLLETQPGRFMLAMSLVVNIIGYFWIRHLCKISL